MSESAPSISHPLGIGGPWIGVSTELRKIEEKLLGLVMESLAAMDEFLAKSHGGSEEEMDARKAARQKSFEADERMKEAMKEYRAYRLANAADAAVSGEGGELEVQVAE